MSEKRQFVRHPSSIPLQVRVLSEGPEPTEVSDISLGGLSFPFHRPIANGVGVAVRVPELAEHIELLGRVVRCGRLDEMWLVGIVFEGRDEVFRMRMVQQICHIESYRKIVRKVEGRDISSDEAAAEWIARHAAQFPVCGF